MGKHSARLDERSINILKREVKKRPCLWNPADENYNDRFRAALAWDEISSLLEIPDDVARMKWKGLRDLYKREINKHNVTNPDDYLGRWRHFKSLSFLYKPCMRFNKQADPSEDNVDDNASYDCSNSPEPVEYVEEDPDIKCEPVEENSGVTVYFDRPIEYEDPIEPNENEENTCDSDMLFLKSLCPYFKQLQPIRKLLVRSKIQELLYNEILQQSSSGSGRDKS